MTLTDMDADFFLQVLGELKTDHMLLEEIQEQTYAGLVADEIGNVFVLGPVTLHNYYTVRMKEIRKQFQGTREKTYLLTEVEWNDFVRVIVMLYEFLTEKEVTMRDVKVRKVNSEQLSSRVRKSIQQTFFERQENPVVHNTYHYEQQILECIRTGDLEHLSEKLEAPAGGQFGILAKEETRANRNLGISMVTLFSRACISGGGNSEIAFTLNDSYIRQIETENDWSNIWVIVCSAAESYTEMIRELKDRDRSTNSLLVDRCLTLIFRSLHGKVVVRELADSLNVNPDYLSRIFREQTGMTIMQYVRKEKISLAKNQLIYSPYALEEIAYYLGFGSQSHFGKIFKEETGMTPRQYREKFSAEGF